MLIRDVAAGLFIFKHHIYIVSVHMIRGDLYWTSPWAIKSCEGPGAIYIHIGPAAVPHHLKLSSLSYTLWIQYVLIQQAGK